MAKLDVSFGNAKIYDVTKFDVKVGEKFTLTLYETESSPNLKWLWSNDPVLESEQKNNTSDVIAKKVGISELYLLGEDMKVAKILSINVVEDIIEPATNLGLAAESPVMK